MLIFRNLCLSTIASEKILIHGPVPQAKRADDNKCEKILCALSVSSLIQVLARVLDLQLMSNLVYVLFIAVFNYSISNSHNDLSRNSSGKYLYDISNVLGGIFP